MDMEKIKVCAITAAVVFVLAPIASVQLGFLHTASAVEAAATDATNEVITTYCVRDFLAAEDAEERLAELKATTSTFARSRLVRESGFAFLPNTTREIRAVSDMCAARLFAS